MIFLSAPHSAAHQSVACAHDLHGPSLVCGLACGRTTLAGERTAAVLLRPQRALRAFLGGAGTRLLRQACRRRSWCARRRPSLSALGARATSAADEARLFRRFRDAPRHLAHAIARLLADLAVSGVSFSRSRRVHRPRPQRLARVLRRVRRPSWARSAPSPRDMLEGGADGRARRGWGARPRRARADRCTQCCAVSTSLALYCACSLSAAWCNVSLSI